MIGNISSTCVALEKTGRSRELAAKGDSTVFRINAISIHIVCASLI